MKKIFDWLREQIVFTAERAVPNKDKLLVLCTVERFINEAEAKWEAECCVINHFNGNRIVVEVHGNQFYRRCVDGWKFCPYCGKPIKISEVE